MLLYRAMKETPEGLPEIGPSARKLGVRPYSGIRNHDVLASKPDDMVHSGEGGLSVAPNDPIYLPRHRRPEKLGGFGLDPVWKIDSDELGPNLRFRLDNPFHGLIQPKKPMTLQKFQAALAETRSRWQLHCR